MLRDEKDYNSDGKMVKGYQAMQKPMYDSESRIS